MVRTPSSDTDPLVVYNNLVRQGAVLGPMINNCSLDQICNEGKGYQNGNIRSKPLKFVDDIADPSDEYFQAQQSNHVIHLGLITSHSSSLAIGNRKLEVVSNFRYLGDKFDSKGSYSVLCKTIAQSSLGTTDELISLCEEVKFGKEQIPNMILLYYSVFLPRLIYNAEAWSSLTEANIQCLQKAQLHYLRGVLEIPVPTPTAALFLDLCILPI